MNLQHQLDNTAGANGSARKMKQVSPHDKPPPTNVGRLIQPNNQKIDELIALIQVENFNITGGGSSINWWINHVCQKHLEPNRKKVKILSSCHQSQKCSTVHLKLVPTYRNTSITATHDEFYAMLEGIFAITT